MNKLSFICAAVAGISFACGISCAEGAAAPSTTANYSAPALFNSGNQAARAGKPALAVLDYERALLLAPNDVDVHANLSAVQASAGIAPIQGRWLDRYDRLAAPNLMYWLGMLGLVLGGVSCVAYRLRSPRRKLLAVAAIIGAAVTALSIGDAVSTAPVLNEAVVMQASPASAAPVVGAEPEFTVPAAEVIQIRDHHQGLLLIKDSQGREGWISRSNVTPVIPR